MQYNKDEISKLLPHRYPLMMFNSLEIYEKEIDNIKTTCASADLNLDKDLWFFNCHFPENPIMPLSLIVECMTQIFSATFLSMMKDAKEIPVISSLGEIRIKKSARPGDSLHFEAVLSSFRRGVAKGNCKVYLNGEQNDICSLDMVEVLPSKMVNL